MGDRVHGWITVGHRNPPFSNGPGWDFEQEQREREAIAAWDNDEQWPSVHKPLFNGPEAKRFDSRLTILDYLGGGAFGRVDKVMHGSICLARKRITRRRGITIDDLRQEGLTMRKLDHRHVVKLVAAYMPRPHELCLLIWPAAVCDLDTLLNDLDQLRQKKGDRDEIMGRLEALELNDLSAIEPSEVTQCMESSAKCPFEFLRGVAGCVARALAHCHLNDVRHLDIKPSNILLKADRVYLADFGISKDVSGQDQTTIDGNPGTEKWRAPELYDEHGSSMQLSDIYSLGLVFLNIATVLYNVRLSEFDDTLIYPPELARHDKLAIREEKLRKLLETLTAHALVTPPFMFTYEGQETVRPRPLVNLISRMISSTPRNRLPADKVDEKLSMLGGIHQIYHAACCKRPISWVEDKWDKKFGSLTSLKLENEALKRKINELQGRDETYERRLENARKAHEHDVSKLQAMLREAEDRCRMMELSQGSRRKNHGREQQQQQHHQNTSSSSRHNSISSHSSVIGLGLTKAQTHPSSIPKRPSLGPSHLSSPRVSATSFGLRTPPGSTRPVTTVAQPVNLATIKAVSGSPGFMQRSPSGNSLTGHPLRSRGSGSKLPLPITPNSRSQTPNLNREQSLTDSSMASSIFSRKSVDTLPTPAQNSPALRRISTSDDKPLSWGRLPAERARRPSTPSGPPSPGLSMSPSAMSSPRALKSDLADGYDTNATVRPPRIPSLQSSKSWAEVAKEPRPSTLRPQLIG
ncbi:putative receptor-like protein kinase [Cladobotryum mycophilum]|uniref:non-specific serine/threonine protein kinase n=1 Tax=Cladobotryum mycophilum TaxID=491253 RepID=A0ABR0SWS7_9HYPO